MTSIDLQALISEYATAQPHRARGGLNALSGFDYQLRLYVAQLAEGLAAQGETPDTAGRVFLEALSDLFAQRDGRLICLQAKRSLTRSALKSTAAEIAAIDGFFSSRHPAELERIRFELVASRGDSTLSWDDLLTDTPEQAIVQGLLDQGRLTQPRIEPDPWWRTIVAVWDRLEDPYGFARFALDRALGRGFSEQDAQRIRDDICERYARDRRGTPATGQILCPGDFEPQANPNPRLDIGREITLARVRDSQYMPRPARRDALHARLEERYELSHRDLQSAARVFWLCGRSGVGKSVLLLQLLERLVGEGRRVLWLGGAAEALEPALRALASQPEEQRPEFVAVDDLYDRNARTRLDLASLGGFIDEAGPRPWPLIVTCGPAEFADTFEEESRYRGFEVHRETINPLAADESSRLADWYRQRTGREPRTGPAFAQARQSDGGLFISLALELEHGEMREFARRFAERITINGLEHALRLPLALNRLYLRAPYGWLGEVERERLATLNQEGDFSLLDPGMPGQVIRLTHPHLGDALYRALRKPGNPTAYAHDLVNAFRRALEEGDGRLAGQLLEIFSARREGVAGERLAGVDDAVLAEGCASAWRKKAPERLEMDDDMASQVATSWACWAAAQNRIGGMLGEGLLARAVDLLDRAARVWPFSWQRLWDRYPADPGLLAWASVRLPDPVRMRHPSWSFVWERVQRDDPERANWRELALTWLAQPRRRGDWHFVWKRLLPPYPVSDWESEPVLALGLTRLGGGDDGPDWAYVLEDLLQQAERLPERAKGLTARGLRWLHGREGRAEWTHVWRALLDQSGQLPEGVSLADLLDLGWRWLQGREERAEWAHVWKALLDQSGQLPEGVSLADLLDLGWQWLQGREERAEWAHVWEALLDQSVQLPEGVSLADLLDSGWQWLQGREEQAEWNYVWKALLDHSGQLPDGVFLNDLLDLEWQWLQGREERAEWTHVWEALLDHSGQLPEGVSLDDLLELGWHWLQGREERAEWAPVWEVLLERSGQLPEGISRADLLVLGRKWLPGNEDRPEWSFVWQKLHDCNAPQNGDINRTDHLDMAWKWLCDHQNAEDWPVVWWELAHVEALSCERQVALVDFGLEWLTAGSNLEAREASRFVEGLLDLGCDAPQFPPLVSRWLRNSLQEFPWPIIAAKFIAAVPEADAAIEVAEELTRRIQTCTNLGPIYKAEKHLQRLKGVDHALPLAISSLLIAFEERGKAPAWKHAIDCLESGKTIKGKIVHYKKGFYAVELEIGLLARLPSKGAKQYRVGDQVELVVSQVTPQKGHVNVSLPPTMGAEGTSPITVNSVHSGIVSGAQPYGLFVDVEGRHGLIHTSRFPAGYDFEGRHPQGSRIRVRVLSIKAKGLELACADGEKADSWPKPTVIEVGREFEGVVSNVALYGLFIRIGDQSGLLHKSKMADFHAMRKAYPVGNKILVEILSIAGNRIELTPADPALRAPAV